MNGPPCESVVLCEGYHDRAFWAGWLLHLKCTDPGLPAGAGRSRKPVRDPWNGLVKGGQFAFHSPSGHFVRIVPCGGKEQVREQARLRLRNRLEWCRRLVVSVDVDVPGSSGLHGTSGILLQGLEQLVREVDAGFEKAGRRYLIDDGRTEVCAIAWQAADPPTPGLPPGQTLERLVASALLAAYPGRGPTVQRWLDSRSGGPPAGPKEHAWSYMAGWYAEFGCEAFYRQLWDDSKVARELEDRLTAAGAWAVVVDLAS